MKNRLAATVLAQPAGLQLRRLRLAPDPGISEENLLQFRKPLGKIGKDFRGDFALIASRPKDARYQDPAWSV
jgi:hypothetical protein